MSNNQQVSPIEGKEISKFKNFSEKNASEQIRRKAKTKYPKRTLHLYVLNRLKKLEKGKQILFIKQNWKIIKKNAKN